MIALQSILFLSILAVSNALPRSPPQLVWGPCNETEVNSTVAIQCGILPVPLDYTNSSDTRRIHLELARVPAIVQPSKGSILLNFGGPGEPGRGANGLADVASLLKGLSGGQHDLVVFDVRGTVNTIPFSCYKDPIDTYNFVAGPKDANYSDVALGELWAQASANAYACQLNANGTGEFIGTAFVARDLMSVVDALGEDGMLRYWGFSYGTTLGATVASMFPDRIDKMILDGVQNPHEYYHAAADFEEWSDSDKVFSGIFSTCLDVPLQCPLAHRNMSAAQLEQAVWDKIYEIKYRPLALGSVVLGYPSIMGMIQQAIYGPTYWPQLTTLLDLLLTGNTNGFEFPPAGSSALIAALEANKLLSPNFGIRCSDRKVRESSYEKFLPAVQQLDNTSKVMGGAVIAVSMTCAQWKMAAKERYQGDFNVRTKNPVLLIGNTFDGHTPLRTAYNVSSGLERSAVLEIDGYGHTSLGLVSECSARSMAAYWLNGTMPMPGTICKVDAVPYINNITWPVIFKKLYGNVTTLG